MPGLLTPNGLLRTFIARILESHGLDCLQRAIPKVVRRMKQEYPNGQNIASAESIFEQVLASIDKPDRETASTPELQSADQSKAKHQRKMEKQAIWDSLSQSQQDAIHRIVRERLPMSDVNSVGYQIMLLDEAARSD